jgi:hypothetical protein
MTIPDELASLSPVDLAGLLDCGFVDRDVRGQLFVTLKGMTLRARTARDVMLMRLGLPLCLDDSAKGLYRVDPAAVRIRTGPEVHFTISTCDGADIHPDARELAVRREAHDLAEARQAARMAGELEIEPPRHLRAV